MPDILLSVDPGSNACGFAIFEDGKLLAAKTMLATKNGSSLKRFEEISGEFLDWFDGLPVPRVYENPRTVVLEDPLLRGKSNNVMQRFIGFLVNDLIRYADLSIPTSSVHFVHPSTVKSRFGSIEKEAVAVGAYHELDVAEKLIIDPLIDAKDFDATDAIAIGLTYLRRTPHDRNNGFRGLSDVRKKGTKKDSRQNKKKKAVGRRRKGSKRRIQKT